MKNLNQLLIALSLLIAIKLSAQSHSTINGLSVSYKPASTANGGANLTDIKCAPNATISLKSNANVAKVYFKIINPQNNAVLYSVNYAINTSPIVTNGVTLFETNGDVVHITVNQLFTLKPYKYELQTEDSQNNLTTVYSVIK